MIQKIQLQETLLQEYSDLEPMFYNFCVLFYPKCIVSLHKAGLVSGFGKVTFIQLGVYVTCVGK